MNAYVCVCMREYNLTSLQQELNIYLSSSLVFGLGRLCRVSRVCLIVGLLHSTTHYFVNIIQRNSRPITNTRCLYYVFFLQISPSSLTGFDLVSGVPTPSNYTAIV